MRGTISIEDAEAMLDVAAFHLHRYEAELSKGSARDVTAMKAYFIAALLAGESVYRSFKDQKKNERFSEAFQRWRRTLEERGQANFFDRMVEHRNCAAHGLKDPTTVALSAISAHLDRSIIVFPEVPDSTVPNPDPDGSPAHASAWVWVLKLKLEGNDALTDVRRFVGLTTEMVEYFKRATKPATDC